MDKHPLSKRDEQQSLSRRALIKWSVAAGAALGVSRSKIFDILEKVGGKGLAEAASTSPTTRSVHMVAGNGGLAWFTLLWPQADIAAGAAAGNDLAWHKPGKATAVQGTDNVLTIGPDTPFAALPAAKQMTGFICGANETHTRQPQSTVSLNGSNIFSVASALQSAAPSVLPIITVGDVDIGTAPGGARAANVGNGTGIVGLFNSAASRAGGLLSQMSNAQLYKAHYEAFSQLNRAANRSTTRTSYTTAIGAAGFLGTNLANELQVTPADLTRYGVDGNTRSSVSDIANTLIITVKAFKLGLTNSVVFPVFDDDPHGAFDNNDVATVPASLKGVLDGFMNDLQNTTDDATMETLSDDTVITIHGDTTKDPTAKTGWQDGTPQNTNQVFVYGAGNLKTGWFGSIDRTGAVKGFGADGKAATYNGATESKLATASIAYAIAKRDDRAVGQFANGVQISGIFGEPKDT